MDEIDSRKAGIESSHQPARKIVEAEQGEQPGSFENKDFELARALAWLTLEEFHAMSWSELEDIFREYLDDLCSFREELFKAMALFVWNLYDKEDLENIAFTDDIFNECEGIWMSASSNGNFEQDSLVLDTCKYGKVREQDVCNILRWCINENKSANFDKPKESDFSKFKFKVCLHPKLPRYLEKFLVGYVDWARDAMLSSDKLDPKGMIKQQLRMELMDRKCFCVPDALYMQSWTRMNFQKLEAVVSDDHRDALVDLIDHIDHIFYSFVETRIERLHICERLVTYPLSGNIFGSWDNEVLEVVKYADLKRRSEGRRFIGTDHLLFYLHQMLVSESASNSELLETHAKNSKVLISIDDDEKQEDTFYHVYQKANKIAMELDHETIGLEHLYVAITSVNDDKCSWEDSVDCVRMAKANRKDKFEYKGHQTIGLEQLYAVIRTDSDECLRMAKPKRNAYLWCGIYEYTEDGGVIDFVKKIQSNTDMQNAIYNTLFKGDKPTHQMSLGESIEINCSLSC